MGLMRPMGLIDPDFFTVIPDDYEIAKIAKVAKIAKIAKVAKGS